MYIRFYFKALRHLFSCTYVFYSKRLLVFFGLAYLTNALQNAKQFFSCIHVLQHHAGYTMITITAQLLTLYKCKSAPMHATITFNVKDRTAL